MRLWYPILDCLNSNLKHPSSTRFPESVGIHRSRWTADLKHPRKQWMPLKRYAVEIQDEEVSVKIQ